MSDKVWFAHSKGANERFQTMCEHTGAVSVGAQRRAPRFLSNDAFLAGLFHDFGKYSEAFDLRLQGEGSGLDHWAPGAFMLLRAKLSHISAMAVHGHHVGLSIWAGVQSLSDDYRSLENRRLTLESSDLAAAVGAFAADGFSVPAEAARTHLKESVASMLDTRFVTSALVDADHSDTATHFHGVVRPAAASIDVDAALENLHRLVEERAARPMADEVRELRRRLRDAAIQASEGERGLYTLEAPTGAGKTLSMLEFALRHMRRHSGEEPLRRIIVVLPFLSLLDQTVQEIRAALGDQAVGLFEHHSLAPWRNPSAEDRARGRELAEDWDAPIVVTTSVQFLQTLFENKTVPLRKLHSVGRSVILLDEIQSIPRYLGLATMRALARLASPDYGCTVVLSTATQPGWEPHVHRFSEDESPYLSKPIAPRELDLFGKVRRARVDWSRARQPMSWEALAEEIVATRRCLAIVNLKAHAKALTQAVQATGWSGPILHLSTNLCPAHRKRILAHPAVKSGDCLLIATQCVEAGVDLDFPVVYRAVAPLEAIVQAAGRCNRNGNGEGEVRVFLPAGESHRIYPGKWYRSAAEETIHQLELNNGSLDLDNPAIFEDYYARLDHLKDTPMTSPEIEAAIKNLDFPAVARLYRLIETQDVVQVLTCYPGAPEIPYKLTADWFRQAQPFTISAHRSVVRESKWIAPLSEDGQWWRVTDETAYDSDLFGFLPDAELPIL